MDLQCQQGSWLEWRSSAHRNEFSVANAKSPFAKFKSYNNVSAKVKTNASSTEPASANAKATLVEDKQLNRFINLGKICNTSFLQKYKIPPRINIPKIEGALTDNNLYSIFGGTEANPLQNESIGDDLPSNATPLLPVPIAKLSYADYKKLLSNNK